MAYGSTGRIYIGGAKYLGYLAADSKGQLQFQSLLEEVKPEDREFITYGIYTTPAGIYFLSRQRLFYWHNDSMKVWKAQIGEKEWGALDFAMPPNLEALAELGNADFPFNKDDCLGQVGSSYTHFRLPLEEHEGYITALTNCS